MGNLVNDSDFTAFNTMRSYHAQKYLIGT